MAEHDHDKAPQSGPDTVETAAKTSANFNARQIVLSCKNAPGRLGHLMVGMRHAQREAVLKEAHQLYGAYYVTIAVRDEKRDEPHHNSNSGGSTTTSGGGGGVEYGGGGGGGGVSHGGS